MRPSETITFYYLCRQGIELLSWRLGHGSTACQWPLTNGVHDFNPAIVHRADQNDLQPSIGFTLRVTALDASAALLAIAHSGEAAVRAAFAEADRAHARPMGVSATRMSSYGWWASFEMKWCRAEGLTPMTEPARGGM